ncbi:DUF317 domain-containing protein [Streptomyces sp. NPDC006923]|uniref:DUF317 domain-containing protein n=1 Tax=Streptomyces sp. NPDC006923 TaxID=3155355 RepID=UPI0033FC69E8
MSLSERHLAAFAADHESMLQFDTQPRSLAGPGDPRHVTHPLLAAGWKTASDPSLPRVQLVSPDELVEVTIDPTPTSSGSWWRIGTPPSAYGPYWHMSFGGLTPSEIVAGVADALARPVPDGESDVGQILTDAGWTGVPVAGAPGHAVSPDQLVHAEWLEEAGRPYPWRVEAAVRHDSSRDVDHVWHAWIGDGTPPHLVAALARALVDPQPVLRAMYDQLGHYSAVQHSSATTGMQVAAAHRQRVAAARTAARRARHAPATSASPAPAGSPLPTRRR